MQIGDKVSPGKTNVFQDMYLKYQVKDLKCMHLQRAALSHNAAFDVTQPSAQPVRPAAAQLITKLAG